MSDPRIYESPPNSGGNDGALPTAYNPVWQSFKNLTPTQVLAFQSFPQDLTIYCNLRRWLATLTGTSAVVNGVTIPISTDGDAIRNIMSMRQVADDNLANTITFVGVDNKVYNLDHPGVKAVHNAAIMFLQNLFSASAQIINGINGGTITARKQIDAIYAPIAPNSPSGTNPSLT